MDRERLDENLAWLDLLRAPGLGAGALRALVLREGSARAGRDRVAGDRSLPAETRDAVREPVFRDTDRHWLEQPHNHLLAFTSADYPPLLAESGAAPPLLLVSGDPDLLWAPQIAMVGARSASATGLANARAFARAFALAGNVVTSGLAEGVDGAAHAAALDAGGKTIAVLGTGPDVVYPRRHGELAARIVEHGALVSEFAPGTTARPEHFPRRNRIISGLSLGTLVIEAGLNSGSLITARLAAEQGREVFALPGSVHNPLARGCHRLIRDGAHLVETAGEVLDALAGAGARLADHLRARLDEPAAPPAARVAGQPDPDYARLLAALDDTPAGIDELVSRTGFGPAALSSMLLLLELDGAVVAAGNGRYARPP